MRHLKIGALVTSLLCTLLVGQVSSSNAVSNLVSSGAKCSKVGQRITQSGIAYICTKNGKITVWRESVASKLLPAVKETDDQYFYGTYGCHNKIMFVRYNKAGKILRNNVIVSTTGNYQLIPKSYENGNLLFETFDCAANTQKIYLLDLKDSSSQPVVEFSGTLFISVVDATIDVASETPLILLLNRASGFQVVSGGVVNNLLWTTPFGNGFSPKKIISQSGYQFFIFGNYTGLDPVRPTGFGGILVDPRQGFTNLEVYSPTLTLSDFSIGVVRAFDNFPLAFNTTSGTYVCGQWAKSPLDPVTDGNCTEVGPTIDNAPLAFSFGPADSTMDLIYGGAIYNLGNVLSFVAAKPTLLGSRSNIPSLAYNNDYVATFEIDRDLGKFSPAWNYYGDYFSHS